MSNVLVTLAEFYEEYPEFNTDEYKNICPIAFRRAKVYISIKNSCSLKDERRKQAIYLLTAHFSVLMFRNISGQTNGGGTSSSGGGLVASASVGEVSISYQQISSGDMTDYWLSSTPYGMELLALFEALNSIPRYIGGSLERVF